MGSCMNQLTENPGITYQLALAALEAIKCETCHGSGSTNDADFGDMYYRTFVCATCGGSGIKPGHLLKMSENVMITQTASEETAEPKKSSDLIESNLRMELWREYDYGGRVYRIDEPQKLFTRPGGTTHRVVTRDGVVHCLPAPGFNGCVLRWLQKEGTVTF
jgi:hypothetical protein